MSSISQNANVYILDSHCIVNTFYYVIRKTRPKVINTTNKIYFLHIWLLSYVSFIVIITAMKEYVTDDLKSIFVIFVNMLLKMLSLPKPSILV